ncbi:amino acid adenylation domain-containing protein [Streptomyces sp. NPDC006475]|uniref:non-ribosomal peptide synthetase n=1 Tax=Streptomyces sp. NPDC006475 TaxID=3155719 RepID=UPI0033AC1049
MSVFEPEETEGYPLSPQQEAAFLRDRTVHETRATCTVRSKAVIDPAGLGVRMQALVSAHEILRTRYVQVAGLRMPVQVIDQAEPVSVQASACGTTLLRAGRLTVEHSFTSEGMRLVLGLPRLSVDRTSWSLLAGLLLDGTADGAAAQRSHELQYADVAGWLSEELERSEPVEWPALTARVGFLRHDETSEGDSEPVTVSLTVEGSTLEQLRAVAERLSASEEAVLLAAWSSLNARYTRHSDDHVLVVTEGRSADGLNAALGMLECSVPVRLQGAPEDTFAQVVLAASRGLGSAEAQEYRCDPRTAAAYDALGTGLSFRHRRDPWAGATEAVNLKSSELVGLLHLDCEQGPDRLFLTFSATSGRVARTDLGAFADAFTQLLHDALAHPERSVDVLRLLAPSEPAPRTDSGGTEHHTSVLRRFLEQAERTPDHPAVRCGNEALGYRELAQRAAAVADVLRARGVRPGDHVPVLTPASVDTVAAMLGTWLAGAAFVPVDPAWPAVRIENVLREVASAPVLVPEAAAATVLSVAGVPLPDWDGLSGTPTPDADDAGNADAESAAYVIFTSGTSGLPKGVVVGHRQLAHYTAALLDRIELPAGAGFAAVSTLAADLSYTAIFPTLASGGCVQLIDTDVATAPEALADWFRTNPVSAMKLVPSHLSALLADARDPAALLPKDALVLGGEVLPRALYERLRELAPQLRLFNHYGPTETTIGASCLALGDTVDPRCSALPVGAGLGENRLTVVDREGKALPPWCPGEVLISGPGIGLGYLDELRAGGAGFGERGGAGHYRSGDLGRLVPGFGVEITGRLDDQVKLRGYRVQLGEVEAQLHRQPGVVGAAVVARSDESGLVSHLDAYVVGADGNDGAASIRDLQSALARELPAAMVPTGWQLLDRLPLTANGKTDRKALAPVETRKAQAGRPRDAIEQRLLVLWSEVLGVEEISPDDDFFDLGGHSLRAIKLTARTNSAFGCRLPMSSIFGAPTVAAMARLVRGTDAQDSNVVPLRQAKGEAPVFCIHPGGGSTLSYWELARLLPADRPVIGIESWGLHGKPAQGDFSEMAENYAAAIAADGRPPVIVGWCFGGLMAWETAQALRRSGQEVAKLIVIDCPAPTYDDGEGESQEAQELTESALIGRFAWHYEIDLPSPLPSGPAAYELLLKEMQRIGHLPPTADAAELRTLFDVYAANMTALDRHFDAGLPDYPAPDYPILLVRAEPADLPQDDDRTWGWGSLAGSQLAFASVDADHHGIMRAPAVPDLATLVAEALDTTAHGQGCRD